MTVYVHITEKDDKAPHQIRLYNRASGSNLYVSCICREENRLTGMINLGPISMIEDLKEAWELYDDPANHRLNRGVRFYPGYRSSVPKLYKLEL